MDPPPCAYTAVYRAIKVGSAGDVKPAKPAKPKTGFFTHQKSDPTDQAKQSK